MKFKLFAAFVAPSIFMMLIFIAFPLISVIEQRFHVTQTVYESVKVGSCTPAPFGAKQCTTETKTQPLPSANGPPVTRTEYVGLQSNRNVLELDRLSAALIGGASRRQRVQFIVIPHLMPLIIFVSLINLMDTHRVFEEIVGFWSQAHVISLQWLTYDFLQPDDAGNRSIRRASASAMLTMMGIVVLLIPLLKRTWRDHRDTMTFWSRRFCWTRRTSPWFRPSQICSTARQRPPIRSSLSPQRSQSRPHFFVLVMFFQKQIVSGLTAGAVKG